MASEATANPKPGMLQRFELIARLYNEVTTRTKLDIANELGIDYAYASRLMKRAQEAGYLTIRPDDRKTRKPSSRIDGLVPQMIELYVGVEGVTLPMSIPDVALKLEIDESTVHRRLTKAAKDGLMVMRSRSQRLKPQVVKRNRHRPSKSNAFLPPPPPPPPPVVLELSPYTGPLLASSPLEQGRKAPPARTCEWITSSKRPWTCCGAPATPRRNRPLYCDEHAFTAFGRVERPEAHPSPWRG